MRNSPPPPYEVERKRFHSLERPADYMEDEYASHTIAHAGRRKTFDGSVRRHSDITTDRLQQVPSFQSLFSNSTLATKTFHSNTPPAALSHSRLKDKSPVAKNKRSSSSHFSSLADIRNKTETGNRRKSVPQSFEQRDSLSRENAEVGKSKTRFSSEIENIAVSDSTVKTSEAKSIPVPPPLPPIHQKDLHKGNEEK